MKVSSTSIKTLPQQPIASAVATVIANFATSIQPLQPFNRGRFKHALLAPLGVSEVGVQHGLLEEVHGGAFCLLLLSW